MRRSYLWAAGIAGVLALWMASPLLLPLLTGAAPHDEGGAVVAEGEAAPSVQKLFRVRTKTFTAEAYQAIVSAQGVTEASSHVEARSRASGATLAVMAKQGSEVKKGDILCEVDLGSWTTDMARAEADRASAERDLNAAEKLLRQRYASESQVIALRARMEAADAAIATMKLEKDYKSILSPADGVLIEKPVEAGTLLSPGDLCATVSTLDPLLVVAQISERYIPFVTEGFAASAKLATGETVEGKVRFIAKTSDIATRTFKVELEVPNPGARIRQGVTAELQAKLPPLAAHKLPGSILSLDDKGMFGVRVLNADDTTMFTPVTVVAQAPDGMWVTGLPTSVEVVTLGQDFVRDGEKVDPVLETADASQ